MLTIMLNLLRVFINARTIISVEYIVNFFFYSLPKTTCYAYNARVHRNVWNGLRTYALMCKYTWEYA